MLWINEFIQNSFGRRQQIYSAGEIDQKVADTLSAANVNAATLANNAVTTAGTNATTIANNAVAASSSTSVQTVDGTNASITLTDSTGAIVVLVNPTTVMPSLQIKMPPNPREGRSVTIIFGGTIAALSPVVTAFSIVVNNSVVTGQALVQQTLPDTPVGGDTIVLREFPSIKKVIRTL